MGAHLLAGNDFIGRPRSLDFAGELAGMAGVTGWEPNEATDAAAMCFRAWLVERGTVGAREDAQAVAQVRAFIALHGGSRFDEWRDPPPVLDVARADGDTAPPVERFRAVNRAGWRRWMRDGEERAAWVYYVLPDALWEALAGLDFKPAVKVLIERGFLIPGRGGKSSQTPRPPGHPQARVYVMRGSILGVEWTVWIGSIWRGTPGRLGVTSLLGLVSQPWH